MHMDSANSESGLQQTARGQPRLRTPGDDGDALLVAAVGRRDDTALGTLYDRHASSAYGLARAIVSDSTDAEDVVAAVFNQVWEGCGGYDPARGSVGAWIMTMTRSRALDFVRGRFRRERYERQAGEMHDPDFQTVATPLADIERSETAHLVRGALHQLTEPQKKVLELAYFRGLSQTEIAAWLDEPLGTIKTRMRTAMVKLRQLLPPELDRGAP